jgi:glutamine synthetase
MIDRRHKTAADVVRLIRQERYEALDLKFVDLFGALQHVTVPAGQVEEGLFGKGFGFDGSSVRGFQAINESDMILRPDSWSAFRDPFFDDPTLSVFCDVVDPRTHDIYSRDSRGLAQRAQQLVRSLGIADKAYFGPEPEFFVFDEVRYDQSTQHVADRSGDRAKPGTPATPQASLLCCRAGRPVSESTGKDNSDAG